MVQSLKVSQLDSTVTEWIELEAQRTGMSVEMVLRRLIYRGFEAERQKTQQQRYHDLDSLAGTWSVEEADEFHHAIADLEQIDANLWP